ncbi:MAG: hypothetical protein CMO55_18965 [Verrucomicrobiales bacterium]|nr:hypothetical protein [Verrucomicrobiales bacterium]
MLACAPVYGQVEDDYHQFTDKKGQQILAMLLGVSDDRRYMKIQRVDGQEFESEINILSLDDQQYIKDWLKSQPEEETDYRLEIAISKKQKESEDHKEETYSLERKYYSYEITIKNLSRETLNSASMEYTIVWEDQVQIYETDGGLWSYRTPKYGDEQRVKLSGSSDVEAVAFNREAVLETESFEIDEVSFFGNQIIEKDEPVGIIVRVLSKDSKVIAEVREGSLSEEDYPWERVIAYSEPKTDD